MICQDFQVKVNNYQKIISSYPFRWKILLKTFISSDTWRDYYSSKAQEKEYNENNKKNQKKKEWLKIQTQNQKK